LIVPATEGSPAAETRSLDRATNEGDMELQASWLLQGYFDFASEDARHTPSQAIRDGLASTLGLPAHKLRIRSYPVGPAWRHTFWWREGEADYAEAQFFIQIPEYPVLTLGLSIEKGREDPAAPPERLLNRNTWDWQPFLTRSETILASAVPAIAASLASPLNLRVRLLPRGDVRAPLENRAFSFVGDRWHERRRGLAEVSEIVEYLRGVDSQQDHWAIVHFAIDLAPERVTRSDTDALVRLLSPFDTIRRHIRQAEVPGRGLTSVCCWRALAFCKEIVFVRLAVSSLRTCGRLASRRVARSRNADRYAAAGTISAAPVSFDL